MVYYDDQFRNLVKNSRKKKFNLVNLPEHDFIKNIVFVENTIFKMSFFGIKIWDLDSFSRLGKKIQILTTCKFNIKSVQ